MIILAFPDYLSQAQRLADRLNAPLAEVSVHHFPDSESFICLPPLLPGHVIFCRSLNQPNDKLIELLLCATTARELGAQRLTPHRYTQLLQCSPCPTIIWTRG